MTASSLFLQRLAFHLPADRHTSRSGFTITALARLLTSTQLLLLKWDENRIPTLSTDYASRIKWLFIRCINATGNRQQNSRLPFYKSVSQQGTKFPLAATPSGLVNVDSFKTLSLPRKSPEAGQLDTHPALQAEEESEERSLFLGKCSIHFSMTCVGNSSVSVSSLHKADYLTFCEAQQGGYWAHVAPHDKLQTTFSRRQQLWAKSRGLANPR